VSTYPKTWVRAAKLAAAAAIVVATAGCSIADKSDKLNAEVDIGIGGILSYIADLHLKASIGFSKTCKESDNGEETGDLTDPVGLRGFL